eukprot:CAMPEP_0113890816 /NCGR_PEP_ID=MMETSP0780_2-20120614/14378_1 /TAXON_ID=652834 /ORGANISM="Palpitomonas bilix" /LENGTH=149 /DNA_ID=CAMNT_0000880299 /DNA_START=197 /DNA_END=646 /DNA_ORIENTATION=+ /assembly_acc=CAM_ASM_000599
MSYALRSLSSKAEVDEVIKGTKEKVLVLRFGRAQDVVCMQQDDILSKAEAPLRKMADIYTVDADKVEVYTHYFDITLIPATLFFYNAIHIKIDGGTQDNTKFIGAFREKQDFIDLVEVVYRGAMRGKKIVSSPIPPERVPKFNIIYKGI